MKKTARDKGNADGTIEGENQGEFSAAENSDSPEIGLPLQRITGMYAYTTTNNRKLSVRSLIIFPASAESEVTSTGYF